MKRATAAGVALCAALLAGCGTLQEPVHAGREPTGSNHLREIARFQSWTLSGRLVVRADGETSRVNVRWRQAGESWHMRFTAPFGVGLLELDGSASGVEARFPDGRRTRTASPESLLESEVGWSVPLSGLRYWIVGAAVPDDARATFEVDPEGRLARLEQAGWSVVYERYGGLDGLALPERIRFSNGFVDATIVVQRWRAEREPG